MLPTLYLSFFTIILTTALTLIYLVISKFSKYRMVNCSYLISNEQKKSIKLLKESIAGFREMKINNSENFFLKNFGRSDSKFRQTEALYYFLELFPKYYIEGIIIFSIIAIASFVTVASDGANCIRIFAFAAQRLLPSIK